MKERENKYQETINRRRNKWRKTERPDGGRKKVTEREQIDKQI